MFSSLLPVVCLCATIVGTLTSGPFEESLTIQDQFEEYNELKDTSRNVEKIRTKRDDTVVGGMGFGGGISSNSMNYYRPYCGQSELCCGNRVFRGLFDGSAQCCGRDYYDSSTARCCDGTVHLVDNYQSQCCGKKLYDQITQVCCNTKTHAIKKNQQCCGSEVYNTEQQICCNGTIEAINNKVLSCCNKIAYEPAKSHCINGAVQDIPINSGLTQICGSQIIDYKAKICCQGQPQDRTYGSATICCGALAISAATQLCCNGTVQADPGDGSECCKSTLYNQQTQVCCNGKVLVRPENSVGDVSYCYPPRRFGVVLAKYSPYFTCCNKELVTDYSTQLCCDNKLYTYNTSNERYEFSCCGSQAFKYREQTCCTDTLVKGANRKCCNRKPYDLNHHVCCAGDLFKHSNVPRNKCCTIIQNVRPLPIEYA